MNNTNLILSVILSIAIIVGWQYFYEAPKLNSLKQQQIQSNALENKLPTKKEPAESYIQNDQLIDLKKSITKTPRIKISTQAIQGSINLVGGRIDDILLKEYKENVNNNEKVRLLSPSNTLESYFIEIGWYSPDPNVKLPDRNTLWSVDGNQLTPENSVRLKWTNKDLVEFNIEFVIDNECMLFVKQTTRNMSKSTLDLQSYSLINKTHKIAKNDSLLHKGFIGVIDKELQEIGYSEMKNHKVFQNVSTNWFGITDKYWLTAIIPDPLEQTSINLNRSKKSWGEKFQLDILTGLKTIQPNQTITIQNKIFIGAKKVKLLDQYAKQFDILLFDRAIDFGKLYIITKPLFYVLSFFYSILGNFGLSIIAITILIKTALFGLTFKAGKSVKKLKALQPEIDRIKKLYSNDKAKLNQEIMILYKKESFNPLAGCLPILIQMPILFAIYKVLYVTIEMRHAPFFGWIQDLSAPDPTSIFTLFGLLPITLPSFLQIGIWPVLMSISMFMQQKISGNVATDPVQEQVMKMLPVILLFMLAHFPAGLMIYWTLSNLLSIVQQVYINQNS